MEENFSSAHHRPHRTYLSSGGGVDMSSYDANNNKMYMVRSKPHGYAPPPCREISKAAAAGRGKKKSIMWHSKREIKRRKRIAKYNLYSMEAKMKDSFKKGYRWLKRTCLGIGHGF